MACAGFTGLNVPTFDAPFMPAIEIGWRMLPRYWGRGYATEAARLALEYGFDVLKATRSSPSPRRPTRGHAP